MEIVPGHKKGDKTLMENKRGLFLTNNVSKVYERVIKSRNKENFLNGITMWQTGGVNDRSTVDNVMLTLSLIEQNRYHKRSTYITFTDAEKCFDKLWLSDGIHELWRCGTDIRDCMIIRKLNAKAIVTVRTPVGITDVFELEEIVRQGTVYGPQICISSMDKINIIGKNITTFYGPKLPIKAGVFMDDVSGSGGAAVANNVVYNCRLLEEKKKMIFNNKKGKTEYVIIPGGKKDEEIQTVTEQVKKGYINRADEHKMLGTWVDESGCYTINIQKRKLHLPYMISSVRQRAHPRKVGMYATDARLKLAEAVIIPSILHNVEAYPFYEQKDIEGLERVQHQVLTGLLDIPISTPYLAILMETGFWTMKARIAYRKLMLYQNILKSDKRRVLKSLIDIQKNEARDTTWYGGIRKILDKYGVKEDPSNLLKSTWKMLVKKKITEKTGEEIKMKLKDMTKGRTVINDKYEQKKYLNELEMKDSTRILKMRLHMSKIPGNFKGDGDGCCTLCHMGIGRIEHYFECSKVNLIRDMWQIGIEDLTSEDTSKLLKLANFTDKVEYMLEPQMSTVLQNKKKKDREIGTKKKKSID